MQQSARGSRVPFVAAWSREREPMPPVTVRRGRLAYVDERPYDRDGNGVLWRRMPSRPGKGRPEFGRVHLLRQRLAMGGLLCQVCGRPAADNAEEGVLWLLNEDPLDPGGWPNPMVTGHPPVCPSCAVWTVHACPHLRRRYAAVRVRRFRRSGVHGVLYRPSVAGPVVQDVGTLNFDDDRLPWMLAGQLMMHLEQFTIVDLD